GDPAREIAAYLDRKIEMSRDFPLESRLFANEMLRGAPNLSDVLKGDLKRLVDEKARVFRAWGRTGKMAKVDPYHLFFAIWSTTQHYADFDPQVRAVLGDDGEGRFHDGAAFLKKLFLEGLKPR
ncbi:MAG: TetR family transcriptional regulator C-terminal domain-containing protein, partial [Pseudomonadota bacterium]